VRMSFVRIRAVSVFLLLRDGILVLLPVSVNKAPPGDPDPLPAFPSVAIFDHFITFLRIRLFLPPEYGKLVQWLPCDPL